MIRQRLYEGSRNLIKEIRAEQIITGAKKAVIKLLNNDVALVTYYK
jgi:hypothetical protein